MPALVGGGVLGLLVLVCAGGAAAWLFTRGGTSSPPAPAVTAEAPIENAPAKKPDEAPWAQGLDELKAATVFVKVTQGPVRASGSGFLFRVEGNTGYLATNEHVINPLGEAGRRALGTLPAPDVTLVFRSGTREEQSFRAELAAADPEQDLAVLKVAGVANLPRPIHIGAPAKLVETLPVTVYGFPFGEGLAAREKNPAITVSKGSVSSIRRGDRDEVAAVQIDGALNPGNSGGPVLDTDGRLVGVAVATIRGAHIGLAVPGAELTRVLDGRVGAVRAAPRAAAPADGDAEVEVEVAVIDPLKRITSVDVHYLRSDLVKVNPVADKDGLWPEMPGSARLSLRLDGRRAVGTFVVPGADRRRSFTFQASYVNAAGRRIYTKPSLIRLRPSAPPVVVRPPVPPPFPPRPIPPRPGSPRPPQGATTTLPRPARNGPAAVYRPYVPGADKQEVPLSGPADDVTVGGGGRYLILRLAGKKLAVFDVQLGKLARELPVPEEQVHIAAGATRLAVVCPQAKLIQLWDLARLERERSALLPASLTSDTIHQICMGSASAGPLFAYLPKEKRTLALDLGTLTTTEVNWTHWSPTNAYGPLNMRASPSGQVLVGWGGGWAGLDVATFHNGRQIGTYAKIPFRLGLFGLPTADGQRILTSGGVYDRTFSPMKLTQGGEPYLVPALEPGFFLALQSTRTAPHGPSKGGRVSLPGVSEMAVYTDGGQRLFNLTDCNELKGGSGLHWEKRIHYYPQAGLLATLGDTRDRLVLRRVGLRDRLEKSGADYLVVLSRPPLATAGKPFSYKLDVASKKGGVKVKLESGPPGLTVTPAGGVIWAVPAKPDKPEADVLLTVSDASGQEVSHAFTVEVAPR